MWLRFSEKFSYLRTTDHCFEGSGFGLTPGDITGNSRTSFSGDIDKVTVLSGATYLRITTWGIQMWMDDVTYIA